MSTLWIIQDGAEMEDGPPRPRLPPLPLPGRHHLLRHRAPHREVSGIASYSEYQHQSMFCIYYYSQGYAEGAGEPEV